MSTPTPLSTLYQTVVQEELGLVASFDEQGDVVFKHPDMGIMYFSLSDSDPEFLRLVYPAFVQADELNLTRGQFLEVINVVNNRCKAIKLTLPQEDADRPARVSASVESFVAAPDTLPDIALLRATVARTVSAIRNGVHELVKLSMELKQAAN
ncbi:MULTISPECIES: hypothetical protein [Achromobacter]|uniref:Uncharacterized protein n=1 Tax=Achromobacter animicus TaxID=1389935 RepID=A0A6S6ZJB9_9BURK|nr:MULTISPECIES: hypothetical protein [Achromobacter]MBV7499885.1 hypothetical protein [Achromobacter sp. ACM05]MCG7327218.1 hypothetical protein [Achromobacter sp. ACRQX]MDH0680983.1 hypothetical protein [Achromobacter animicus]CAB3682969.1 hypothetical protein LMG26690_01702 [Achromobacter animicus]CAB3847860.1 hypothetical protein LMG26689_01817 [Achromobacter animicus]